MNIEVGKYYKTRNGCKVRIYALDGLGTYSIHGAWFEHNRWTSGIWADTGEYVVFEENSKDIVGEWQEELDFDFSALPAWTHWIAMESNGIWFGYEEVPHVDSHSTTWTYKGNCIHIPNAYSPKNYTGSWQNSLYKKQTNK